MNLLLAFNTALETPLDPSSISHSEVYAMMEDQGKKMWFGTFDGPKRLNVGKFENLFHEIDLLTQKNSENYVLSVIQGQTGDYWIGTDGGGINNVYPGSTQIQHYKHNPGATPNSLSHQSVRGV